MTEVRVPRGTRRADAAALAALAAAVVDGRTSTKEPHEHRAQQRGHGLRDDRLAGARVVGPRCSPRWSGSVLPGDAFTVANTLPNVIYLVIAGGVLSSVLVPQLVKAARNPDGGAEFTGSGCSPSPSRPCSSSPSSRRHWPGSSSPSSPTASPAAPHPGRLSFAVICLPQIFFYGIYALLGQVLNARGRLLAFGWAPAAANVVAIAALVVFPLRYAVSSRRRRGPWTWSGCCRELDAVGHGQGAVVVVALWRTGFRYRPVWGFRGVGLRATSTVAGWAFAALLVSQAGYAILTNVLSRATDAGEPASLGPVSAMLIFMLPLSLAALSPHHRALPADVRGDPRRGLPSGPAATTTAGSSSRRPSPSRRWSAGRSSRSPR